MSPKHHNIGNTIICFVFLIFENSGALENRCIRHDLPISCVPYCFCFTGLLRAHVHFLCWNMLWIFKAGLWCIRSGVFPPLFALTSSRTAVFECPLWSAATGQIPVVLVVVVVVGGGGVYIVFSFSFFLRGQGGGYQIVNHCQIPSFPFSWMSALWKLQHALPERHSGICAADGSVTWYNHLGK